MAKPLSVLDAFRLDGRIAAVTGTSRGIGSALAIALAEAGADIIHLDRTRPKETSARIQGLGRRSHVAIVDLARASTDELEAAVAAATEAVGDVDILVNNAGTVGRGRFVDTDEATVNDVLALDLVAALRLSQVIGNRVLDRGWGRVINVASLMSFQGGIGVAAYATAKHGLVGLTKALANEWAAGGVTVNAIAPGYITTDINADLRNDRTRAAEIDSRIPAGRWGTPSDLAGAVVFLASEASSYVTGHVLVVDGGWLSR